LQGLGKSLKDNKSYQRYAIKAKYIFKDQHFYSTRDNLWNNPHRTASSKIKGYYHEPEEYFKSKEHYILNEFRDPF
jgi:hypothetical protein